MNGQMIPRDIRKIGIASMMALGCLLIVTIWKSHSPSPTVNIVIKEQTRFVGNAFPRLSREIERNTNANRFHFSFPDYLGRPCLIDYDRNTHMLRWKDGGGASFGNSAASDSEIARVAKNFSIRGWEKRPYSSQITLQANRSLCWEFETQ